MGVFRVVGFLALLTACDKGKIEPTKGSAQPPPAPLPSPDPAPPPVDAMSVDEQLLRGKMPDVWVRACNDTGKELTNLEWYEKFKDPLLPVGWCTTYRPADTAYSYTYAAFRAAKVDYVIQPIDYMGETPLAAGHWSYHIKNLDPAHKFAEIRAAQDKLTDDPPSSVRACNDTNHDVELISGPLGKATVPKGTCSEYVQVPAAGPTPLMTVTVKGMPDLSTLVTGDQPLPPGTWSYHITRLLPKDGQFACDARPDTK